MSKFGLQFMQCQAQRSILAQVNVFTAVVRRGPLGPRIIRNLLLCALIWPALSGGYVPDIDKKPLSKLRPCMDRHPQTGMLLIARRDLPDPNFARSVVLVLRNDDNSGTLGIIINQPTRYRLNDVLPQLKGLDKNGPGLYFGGPIDMEGLLFLFRSSRRPVDATPIMQDIYLGGDLELLENALIGEDDANKTRVYLGHAVWFPGQLEAEISRGDWHVYPADKQTVLGQNPELLWQRLIEIKQPGDNLAGN